VSDEVVAMRDETFDSFYATEFPALLRLATALCGSTAIAEELVQDAMVSVLARWRKVRRYERPGAYARRVVLNAATSHHRRRQAERRAYERHGIAAEAVAMADDATDFWRVVQSLPARQAQIVTLFYVEDLSTAQIGAALGIAEGTVRASLHAGRQSLAARLGVKEGMDR
jgi:RNA polymerase sigma factor (sigma-70 family)